MECAGTAQRRRRCVSIGLGRLTRFCGRLALPKGSDGPSDDAHGKESEVHQSSRLPNAVLQNRRKIEIDHALVVKPHEDKEQQNDHEEECFQDLYQIHNLVPRGVLSPTEYSSRLANSLN